MTLRTPGALPWENLDVFFSHFATEVELSSGVTLKGIYTAESTAGDTHDGPTVVMKKVDLDDNSVTHGDTVTIDGLSHAIAGIRPDGTGLVEVILDP